MRKVLVEGYLCEKEDRESRFSFITTAVWKSQRAFENARKTTPAEFKRLGFNPRETMATLKIARERDVYERSPY